MVLPRGPVRAHVSSPAPGAQRRPADRPVPREQAQGGLFLQVQVQTWIPCARLLAEVEEVSGLQTNLGVWGVAELGLAVRLEGRANFFLLEAEPILCDGNLEGHC